MSPEQCRAARALLDISRQTLAELTDVSATTIKDFEQGVREPKALLLKALTAFFAERRIEMIEDDDRIGVAIARKISAD